MSEIYNNKDKMTDNSSNRAHKVFLTPAEYEAKYGEINKQKDRERNILLLLRLRPAVFTLEEQSKHDVIKAGI